MPRRPPSDHDRFYDDLADAHVQRDAEREPRPARRFTVSRERVRNLCRFADVLGESAYQEWLAFSWPSVLGANLYKAAQFAARGIGAVS